MDVPLRALISGRNCYNLKDQIALLTTTTPARIVSTALGEPSGNQARLSPSAASWPINLRTLWQLRGILDLERHALLNQGLPIIARHPLDSMMVKPDTPLI